MHLAASARRYIEELWRKICSVWMERATNGQAAEMKADMVIAKQIGTE